MNPRTSSLLFNQLTSWLSSVIVDSMPKNIDNDDEIKLVRNVDRYYEKKKTTKVTPQQANILDEVQLQVRELIELRYKEFYEVPKEDDLSVQWFQLLPFFVLWMWHMTKEFKDTSLDIKFGHFNYKNSCKEIELLDRKHAMFIHRLIGELDERYKNL